MSIEWKTLPLEDCMAAIIDYRGKSPEKTKFGVPLVTAKIIKGGRIEEPEEFIAEQDFDEWMRRGMPEPGDIVITTEAPLGEVAQLDGRRIALAQRVITLRGKKGFLDNSFLKFLLQSRPVQEQLRSRATGTTVLGIRQSELRKVSLTVPPLAEQETIAAILGALDDKIELNRQINRTLEAVARALFTSWFVDFDPVRAKAEGRAPSGIDAQTAQLFPSDFVESELGPIPKGWQVGTLGEVAEQVRMGIKPANVAAEAPYIGLDHMPQRSIALGEWGSASQVTSQKARFQKGDILFGKLRPYFHKVGVAPIDGVCSTDIVVVRPKKAGFWAFSLGHLSSERFVAFATAGSDGTKMPRTSWSRMSEYRTVIPAAGPATAFNAIVARLVDQIHSNLIEARPLAHLRAALLPCLVLGKLRVSQFRGEETGRA